MSRKKGNEPVVSCRPVAVFFLAVVFAVLAFHLSAPAGEAAYFVNAEGTFSLPVPSNWRDLTGEFEDADAFFFSEDNSCYLQIQEETTDIAVTLEQIFPSLEAEMVGAGKAFETKIMDQQRTLAGRSVRQGFYELVIDGERWLGTMAVFTSRKRFYVLLQACRPDVFNDQRYLIDQVLSGFEITDEALVVAEEELFQLELQETTPGLPGSEDRPFTLPKSKAEGPEASGILDPLRKLRALREQGANVDSDAWSDVLDAPSRSYLEKRPELLRTFLDKFPSPGDIDAVDFVFDGPSFLVETAGGMAVRVAWDTTVQAYRINLVW